MQVPQDILLVVYYAIYAAQKYTFSLRLLRNMCVYYFKYFMSEISRSSNNLLNFPLNLDNTATYLKYYNWEIGKLHSVQVYWKKFHGYKLNYKLLVVNNIHFIRKF